MEARRFRRSKIIQNTVHLDGIFKSYPGVTTFGLLDECEKLRNPKKIIHAICEKNNDETYLLFCFLYSLCLT